MDKRGLIGKILLVIGIVILVIGVVLGFTAYQAYDLINTVKQEQSNIQNNFTALQKGDCSTLPGIENSMNRIKTKAENACKNPVISSAVEKLQQVPIKCKDISTLETQMQTGLSQIRAACANKTL